MLAGTVIDHNDVFRWSFAGQNLIGTSFAWYENMNGSGTVVQKVVSAGEILFDTVDVADMDGDGDKDLLVGSQNDRVLAWYENSDGKGKFGPRTEIPIETERLGSVQAVDLDGDGDNDVVAESSPDFIVYWYDNVHGQGTFGKRQVITDGAVSANVADIDRDGDLDVVVNGSGRVNWYEQRIPGDANLDGIFKVADFVSILQAGKYEDDIPGNATWAEGDWDGDGDFTTADIVLAFQGGKYDFR